MNVLASECSSGCESGWTLYLEHSNFLSPNASPSTRNHNKDTKFIVDTSNIRDDNNDDDCEEEEDLSMLSDASSGPPHFHEDYIESGYQYQSSKPTTLGNGATTTTSRRQKKRENGVKKQEHPINSFLDDTASSKNNFDTLADNNQASMESVLDYSQAFSANQFQGRSAYQDHHHFGFLQSSHSGNHFQNNQWF